MFDIVGFDSNYKVPKFAARIDFGAGRINSPGNLRVLLVGMKTSAGSMTADAEPVQCFSEDEAETYAGAGSQLARMAYKAFQVPGVEVWLGCVTEPGGGTAATATLTIAGSWSTAGQLGLTLAGETFTVATTASDTATTAAEAVVDAVNERTRLPFTAANVAGVVTITCKNKGIQGKDWMLHVDTTLIASGMTATAAGSAAQGTNRVRFGAAASGTGTEDVTTILTQLQARWYARIAPASNDATNAALWETHVNTKALWNTLLLEQLVFGYNGTYANSVTLAQTTLNAQRAQLLWERNCESHPCEIAAFTAALRAGTEGDDPVPDYDGEVLLGIAPQRYDADIPTDSEAAAALNNGVTPCSTVNGESVIIRAICTKSLTSSNPDYRTLDIGDVVMPDYATLQLKLIYETDFRPNNKYVGDNPAAEAPEPPSNVAYPKLWEGVVFQEEMVWFRNGWIEDPTENPPVATYNEAARRIQSSITLVVRRVQHQLSAIVRQSA